MIIRKFTLTMALFAVSLTSQVEAGVFDFSFTGPGVSGSVVLTYGAATDAKYSQAYEVTGISGSFTDTNNGLNIVNAAIGSLVAITHDTPEVTNLLAPNDFSRFAVAANLPVDNGGFLTYDNLYYPAGSPQTASDYPASGGFLDIYGLMFDIGGGKVVNFWSNGISGGSAADYGVAVANTLTAFDYVSGGVSVVPEPNILFLLGNGLLALVLKQRYSHIKSRIN
ncbi:hypothetical protein KEF85_14705 [Methylomonas paludis]|uniref:PEP-CTERM protein-sorting domain-containing protein n=1 Tax=Methylomonas paludis TaxID=1173101 RepID=A0A975MMX3_9GAMM|nr:hypothetical protein [Methylomonas paludis]QWF70559.1 hypothetical protein KEF85_14705 [Methylomonas paludis]